jgi:hypothetical protein
MYVPLDQGLGETSLDKAQLTAEALLAMYYEEHMLQKKANTGDLLERTTAVTALSLHA